VLGVTEFEAPLVARLGPRDDVPTLFKTRHFLAPQ
jgi:hypothetical protein